MGYELVYQAMKNICNNLNITDTIRQKCNERITLSGRTFYSVTYEDEDLLSPKEREKVFARLTNVFGIRVWNYFSYMKKIDLRDGSALSLYISKVCPVIQNKFEFI